MHLRNLYFWKAVKIQKRAKRSICRLSNLQSIDNSYPQPALSLTTSICKAIQVSDENYIVFAMFRNKVAFEITRVFDSP